MSALPLPETSSDEIRRSYHLYPISHGREHVDVVMHHLGDVRDANVVLNCYGMMGTSEFYAENLIRRILEAGAARVEFANCVSRFWAYFADAAARLGVADRVYRVGNNRLFGIEHEPH